MGIHPFGKSRKTVIARESSDEAIFVFTLDMRSLLPMNRDRDDKFTLETAPIKIAKEEMIMICIFRTLLHLCYLMIITSVLFTHISNAQWIQVYNSGIPTCITSDGEYIYVGFHNGTPPPDDTAAARNIIRSSDLGTTWENVSNGLPSGSMYSLKVYALSTIGNKILAGTTNGIFISSDHGGNWIKTEYNPIYGEVNALLVVDSLIYAGSVDDRIVQKTKPGVFISSDEGQSWVRSDSGIKCPNCNAYRSIYAFARIDSTIFAGGLDGVFSSKDKGKTWIFDSIALALSFAVIDSTLFVGHSYASFISRSTDFGMSWVRVGSGLPEHGIRYLAASDKNLFGASIYEGIYYSSDMGEHWEPVNDGCDQLSDFVSEVDIIDNYVFAGTGRYGLWRRRLSEITSVGNVSQELPKGFELKQNYPNPFNPSTVISYNLPVISDVSLRVYDILGREVTTLVNENQESGIHFATFDGTPYASGVYFYRLTAPDINQVKKMLLTK